MSEQYILNLNYEDFEDSLLSKEFDKKAGLKSFSDYVTQNCNCICVFNDNNNQEEMDEDSWILKFKNKEDLSKFSSKYNFCIENSFLIQNKN